MSGTVHLHRPTSGPVCGATVKDRATEQTPYRSEVTCTACLATLQPVLVGAVNIPLRRGPNNRTRRA